MSRLGYIAEETARIAADYNFYWSIANTKTGIEIEFITINLLWSDTVTLTNLDINGLAHLSDEDWQKAVTDVIEKCAEKVDNAEADYFAKKMCQKNFDWLFEGKA